MTIKELIDQLNNIKNKDRIVILSKDSEGNRFSPLADMDTYLYKAETTWCGEISIEKLTDKLIKWGFSEKDIGTGEPAIVLFPIS